MKFDFCVFFESLSGKFKFGLNVTRITGTLREGRCRFMIISGLFLLTMTNVSEKTVQKDQNTSFMFNNLSLKSYRL